MKTYTVTKSEVKSVKSFLESIPASKWVNGTQTEIPYDDIKDTSNVGYKHCYIGHVSINFNSPWVLPENKDRHNLKILFTSDAEDQSCLPISLQINRLSRKILGVAMHEINNGESIMYYQSTTKDRVMQGFTDLIEQMEDVETFKY